MNKETGSSYPDMDKIIKIAKVLNCTLEDLLDDGTLGNTAKKEGVMLKPYLQEALEFITRTYNMLISMSMKEKLKCIFEMCLLGIFLLIIEGITTSILIEITYSLLEFIPYYLRDGINDIFKSIYMIIVLIFGIIIFIHLFKIRYLDYYITIKDQNVSKKQIEKEIEIKEEKREKIIIRDPVHSTPHFLKILEKAILLILKILAVWFALPIIFAFISCIVLGIISLCHITVGVLFLLGMILFLSLAVLCFLIIYLIYNFVFSRKQNMKFVFIAMISSFLFIGISIGLSIINILSFQEVNSMNGLDTIVEKENIEVTENTTLLLPVDNINVEYVIDNSKEKIELEIKKIKEINYEMEKNEEEYIMHLEEMSIYDIYHIFIEDMKNKQIRNYTADGLIHIKITLSENSYKILNRNYFE